MALKRLRRRTRRSRQHLLDVPLTPLIDTALTLLIIFMITTPMMHNAIKVNLPKGQAKEDRGTNQELVVYIDKDGKLYFNGSDVKTVDQILAELKGATDSGDHTVYVKADQGASYGAVYELVDQLKVIGGISSVALTAKKYA